MKTRSLALSILLPLLALPSLLLADKAPRAPYILRFAPSGAVDASRLKAALEKIDGVSRVEVNGEKRWAKVGARNGALLPERHLRATAERNSQSRSSLRGQAFSKRHHPEPCLRDSSRQSRRGLPGRPPPMGRPVPSSTP